MRCIRIPSKPASDRVLFARWQLANSASQELGRRFFGPAWDALKAKDSANIMAIYGTCYENWYATFGEAVAPDYPRLEMECRRLAGKRQ